MNHQSPDHSAIAFYRLLALFNIALGGLCGALIALPIAAQQPQSGTLLGAACIAFGILNGYRWRTSRAFLYFALVTVLALASLVSFAGLN